MSPEERADDPRKALFLARRFFDQEQLAKLLHKSPRTIRRWEKGEIAVPTIAGSALREILHQSTDRPDAFTFVDLFAGIGGLRIPFDRLGGRCVFTCEWDVHCARTYRANFAGHHDIRADIKDVENSEVPDHDLLLAGFPCQPFSLAGVSKKNSLGRAHGFADETQGTLFFELARIIQAKRPRVFLLENVKNLRSHDNKRTYRLIRNTLTEIGYHSIGKGYSYSASVIPYCLA